MEVLKQYLNNVYSDNKEEIEDNEYRGKVHNWVNYIPDELADQWDQLSIETKAAIYLVCKPIAQKEEWD